MQATRTLHKPTLQRLTADMALSNFSIVLSHSISQVQDNPSVPTQQDCKPLGT